MARISYHASHEQFSPADLLRFACLAEAAGFDAVFSSDHIHPWSPVQGQSGFMWVWLGAALQATANVTFAAITIPGGWRYHPAVIAQAIASLEQMFPGRMPWIALGSGEALNERVVGLPWPPKAERNERLYEAASIIRDLLSGERVTHRGIIPVRNAQIWSKSKSSPQLVAAALSPETAEWAGTWADGLLTVATHINVAAEVVQAFQRDGAGKPMHAKVDLSWAATEEEALAQAHRQWRVHAIDRAQHAELSTPEAFEAAARLVQPEDMRRTVLVSANFSQHIEWLQARLRMGFQTLSLHNVGTNQQEFIEAFGKHVLPALRLSG